MHEPDQPPVLSYGTAPRSKGVDRRLGRLALTFCGGLFLLFGAGVLALGIFLIYVGLTTSHTRDRNFYIGMGVVITLLGLVLVLASLLWQRITMKRPSAYVD